MADQLFAAEQEYLRSLPARAPHLTTFSASGASQADHVGSHCEVSCTLVDNWVSSIQSSSNMSDRESMPAISNPCCQTCGSFHSSSCICSPSKDDSDTMALPLSTLGLLQSSACAQPQAPPTAALDELWEMPEMLEDNVQQLTLHILGGMQPPVTTLCGGVLTASGGATPDKSVQRAIER
eukprot:CAMPEP_0179096452 /NCGR_PEP_ID=MMETSP0796-20121207/44341_1 /TAXON_ID=73915 /ORGANISM="Pyrodinium bahamense, Strain pbaha01" /LENGTH=179 /DNA_ID=CAMNT_0020794171 /DNA_START=223 /DNA_END=759 /DNA_ORIENTATION=-